MGVRIHKVLGYGLSNLSLDDPRIDISLFKKKRNQAYEITPRRFMTWLKKKWDNILEIESDELKKSLEEVKSFSQIELWMLKEYFKNHRDWTLGDCIICKDNVLLFVPLTAAHNGICGWKRYDDIIDYMEETNDYKSENHIVNLTCTGIFPYEGLMIRYRDPEINTWKDYEFFLNLSGRCGIFYDGIGFPNKMPGREYNMLVGKWDKNDKPIAKGMLLDHLKNDWRPYIPSEILVILLWLEDCLNFNGIKDSLRPMIFTYWE